jgi:hypothetical protein
MRQSLAKSLRTEYLHALRTRETKLSSLNLSQFVEA